MKILVVSRPGNEYVLDLVVHGLYNLGHTVIDFPRKENYKKDTQKHMIGSRLPKHDFDLSKESDFDFLAGKTMGDLMYAEQQATLNTLIKIFM